MSWNRSFASSDGSIYGERSICFHVALFTISDLNHPGLKPITRTFDFLSSNRRYSSSQRTAHFEAP